MTRSLARGFAQLTGPRTHYEVLGVRPSASFAEIRCSYIKLIKERHPDQADAALSPYAAQDSALLNQSYSVLKDAKKRRVYDLSLQRGSPLPLAGPSVSVIDHIDRQGRLGVGRFILLAVAAVSATVLLGAIYIENTFEPFPQSSPAFQQPLAATLSRWEPAEFRVEAIQASQLSVKGASDSSRRCFEDLKGLGNTSEAERCIVFDYAVMYWHDAPGAALPHYFRGDVAQQRHQAALPINRELLAYRLNYLQSLAISALLEEVREVKPDYLASKELLAPADAEARSRSLPEAEVMK